MDKVLEFISSLRNTDVQPEQLFNLFADRLRERFGACAMALICTEGLGEDEFRILSYTDENGMSIIDDLDFATEPDPLTIRTTTDRSTILDTAQPVIHRGSTPGIHPMFGDLFQDYIDAISLPMFQQNGVHRWLLLMFSSPGNLEKIDVERGLIMATLAINYVFSVEDARRLEKANEWIHSELEAMARIQKLLLPPELDTTPGIKVARMFQPFSQVGGDYYEIVSLSEALGIEHHLDEPEPWGFMIADASGHGAAAAVEIAMFDAVLRTYQPIGKPSPGDVLTYANKYFFTRMLRTSFITAFVSSYDPEAGTLTYANAGHPAPIIKRANNNELVSLACQAGIPLGIEQQTEWQDSSITVNEGDLLILYTDGVTESKSASGEEYGVERLQACIASSHHNANACMEAIQQAVKSHQGSVPAQDDQTLIVIQILVSEN